MEIKISVSGKGDLREFHLCFDEAFNQFIPLGITHGIPSPRKRHSLDFLQENILGADRVTGI